MLLAVMLILLIAAIIYCYAINKLIEQVAAIKKQ